MLSTTDITYFGEDLGMGANKLYGPWGGLQLLSQVATDGTQRLGGMLGLKTSRRPLEIVTSAGNFHVGLGAHDHGRPVENLDFDRLTGAPEMLALFYGALTQYARAHGRFNTPLSMMVGLPIQMMSGDEARANAALVKAWMKGEHAWTADGQPYECNILDVHLTPQPVGALFDYLLDDNGQMIPARKSLLKAEVGIISVGFNTIELLVVRDGAPIERFTAGQTSGVRRLLELVNHDQLYSLGELDSQLRAGRLDVRAALPVWAREVNGEIEKRWGNAAKRFSRVLLVGGGAVLLGNQLSARFNGRAAVSDEPVLSIARGLYKLAVYKGA